MTQRRVFQGQAGLIAAVFAASLLINLLLLTAPIYMLQLFGRVLSSGSLATLAALTLGAAIALAFHFVFDVLRQRLISRLGSRLESRLGPAVVHGQMRDAATGGTIAGSPIRDVQELRGFVTSPSFTALLDAPWSVAFVGIIYLFHPVLGHVALAGLVLLALIGLAGEALARRPSAEAALAHQEANRHVSEMTRNAETVLVMGNGPALVRRWQRLAHAAMHRNAAATDRVAVLSALARLVRMGLQIAVLGTGMLLVLGGQIAPGVMIATSILLGRAAAPVEQSIAGWRAFSAARAAAARLRDLLADGASDDARMPLPDPEGRLSVDGATVVKPGRQAPALFDVSLDLEPGQSLGIVGPSGAGKTTLARALVGLEPLTRGTVRLDEAALSDWPAAQLGRHVGFLPQRVELMRGTIAENIATMDEAADPADIVAAARLAQVHDLILSLPGGYNADVGPRGDALSAGQRQRIGLARAFFGRKRIIVLDEPNANLDPDGEAALARAIEGATAAGAVVAVVTHRMNLLRRVSHAAVLSDGRLQRFGPAREVLEAMVRPVAAATDADIGEGRPAMAMARTRARRVPAEDAMEMPA